MATFILNSIIKIDRYKPFRGCNEITIKKSIRNYNDTAVVKLPATAVLKQNGVAVTKSALTANAFKRGDKINIQLGYNGVMREEFEGFIRRVNKTTPCEIECDGYAFLLRNKEVRLSYKNTPLKKILSDIIAGTEIVLSKDIEDFNVDVLELPKMSAFKALGETQKKLGGIYAFHFTKNVLWVGLALTELSEKNKKGKADVKYKIGYNVVRDGQMKQRLAGDNEVEVEVIHREKTGNKKRVTVGLPNSDAVIKRVQSISDIAILNRMANEKKTELNYSGYDGQITGFLQPFCLPSQKMEVEDPKYPERTGNFLIEGTEVKYNTSGARRNVKISIQL